MRLSDGSWPPCAASNIDPRSACAETQASASGLPSGPVTVPRMTPSGRSIARSTPVRWSLAAISMVGGGPF